MAHTDADDVVLRIESKHYDEEHQEPGEEGSSEVEDLQEVYLYRRVASAPEVKHHH
jgi:hypothetical protein